MRRPFLGNYPLTQLFGVNPQNYAQFGLKGHNGLDFGCPTGTRILAPHSGTVIEATNDPAGYGLYLKIENDAEGSVLAHNANFLVKVGDVVSEGQEIAISDNTGNSTGPHCHWGYYRFPRDRQNGFAGFINQLPLMDIPTTQPVPDANAQTKFDFGDPYGVLEMQAVRSQLIAKDTEIQRLNTRIQELDTDISNLQVEVNNLGEQVKALKSPPPSVVDWFKHLFG